MEKNNDDKVLEFFNPNSSKYKVYNNLNNIDKLLFLLYETPNLTVRSLTTKVCYPVTSVNNVTSVTPNNTSNKSNKSNKRNKVTGGSGLGYDEENKVKVMVNRLEKKGLLIKDKSTIPLTLNLTIKGRQYVENKINKYEEELNKIIRIEEEKNLHERLLDGFKEFFNNNLARYINEITKKGYLTLNLKELMHHDPELLNNLIDDTKNTLTYINIILKGIDFNTEETPKYVMVEAPKSIEKNITQLRSKDLDKLSCIVGEVRSRSQSSIKITTTIYECPSCGNRTTVLQLGKILKQPKQCGCGRKGKFKLVDKDIVDILKLTVNDLYENIESKQVPEEINVFLEEDKFRFSTIKEGDRVRLIGELNLIPIYFGGTESTEMLKVFNCYGIENLEDDYDKIFITDEDEEGFTKISEKPIDYFSSMLFRDLNDVELPCMISLIGLFGRLNVLFCGLPGCGKSEIQERISKVSLRGSFVNCITASQPGVVGSVNKNPFTGKWSIDGGVLRPMHPGGLAVLDELNRDGEGHNIQKAVLEVMSSNTLRITKAGNRLEYPCDISIWASVNPLSFSPNLEDYKIFGLLHPLWDRFDFVAYFHNKLDFGDVSLVKKLLRDNTHEWVLPKQDLLLIRKYQIRASMINFKLGDSDYEKLALLSKKLVEKVEPNASYRRIGTMKQVLEAICRLHLRDSPVDEDFRLLSDIIIGIADSKILFHSLVESSNSVINQEVLLE